MAKKNFSIVLILVFLTSSESQDYNNDDYKYDQYNYDEYNYDEYNYDNYYGQQNLLAPAPLPPTLHPNQVITYLFVS